jgi:UDP-N-acetylmuramate: L-alanyl-gamma-D-glutamyl-meso-diaminopimelate ligase
LVLNKGLEVGCVEWSLTGLHNVHNGLAAIVAAEHIGISPEVSAQGLCAFQNVKRRMEIRANVDGITLYDDFAHHPTAIETTLKGLRARVGTDRIIAVLEPRSNTMKMGVHANLLGQSLETADLSLIYQAGDLGWDVESAVGSGERLKVFTAIDPIVEFLKATCRSGDHIVFMSNGGFGSIHDKTERMLSDAR